MVLAVRADQVSRVQELLAVQAVQADRGERNQADQELPVRLVAQPPQAPLDSQQEPAAANPALDQGAPETRHAWAPVADCDSRRTGSYAVRR